MRLLVIALVAVMFVVAALALITNSQARNGGSLRESVSDAEPNGWFERLQGRLERTMPAQAVNLNRCATDESTTNFPKHILQTYKHRVVPGRMHNAMRTWTEMNPGWGYTYLDDRAARMFIDNSCPADVVDAYDCLLPGAYKADILRLAYLYVHGGVYADISMVSTLSLDSLLETLPSTTDLVICDDTPTNPHCVYQALIIAAPKHPIIQAVLKYVVRNVQLKRRPTQNLSITGPGAFGEALNLYLRRPIHAAIKKSGGLMPLTTVAVLDHTPGRVSMYNGRQVVRTKYANWAKDRDKGQHYSTMFGQGKIYRTRLDRALLGEARNLLTVREISGIPCRIFQTWESSYLTSPAMLHAMRTWSENNPGFQYVFHDRLQRRDFIEKNFPPKVLAAYDSIIAGAFKADIWRLCVLAELGGVYADADSLCNSPIEPLLLQKGTWVGVRDNGYDAKRVCNGFIAAPPKHPFILAYLDHVVNNITERIVPKDDLSITGPGAMTAALHRVYGKSDYVTGYCAQIDAYLLRYSLNDNAMFDHEGSSFITPKFQSYDKDRVVDPGTDYATLFKKGKIYTDEVVKRDPELQVDFALGLAQHQSGLH